MGEMGEMSEVEEVGMLAELENWVRPDPLEDWVKVEWVKLMRWNVGEAIMEGVGRQRAKDIVDMGLGDFVLQVQARLVLFSGLLARWGRQGT